MAHRLECWLGALPAPQITMSFECKSKWGCVLTAAPTMYLCIRTCPFANATRARERTQTLNIYVLQPHWHLNFNFLAHPISPMSEKVTPTGNLAGRKEINTEIHLAIFVE